MKKVIALIFAVGVLFSCSQEVTDEIVEQEIIEVSYEICPPDIIGEVTYIPFPVDIDVDGDLADWKDIPATLVDYGSMTTADPLNNSSFTYSLAAKDNEIYAFMTSVDANIITGQHPGAFWNEDSLEIYFNFTDDMFVNEYSSGIYQININPSTLIGYDKVEITADNITGSNTGELNIEGYLFTTDDGWGFELRIILPFIAEHAKEVGFQAHSNGASVLDRDVKLIWSHDDIQDTSYANPDMFGHGLFFGIGETILPQPSIYVPPEPPVFISVNQTGYFTTGPKVAVYPTKKDEGRFNWTLYDLNGGEEVASGKTEKPFLDDASGDYVNIIDFSDFETEGEFYFLIDSVLSEPFAVGNNIYRHLSKDSMNYFYKSRVGIEIESRLAGGEAWARPAGHVTDEMVTGFKGIDAQETEWFGTDYTLDVSKGWYDAGDFGKYVVNSGIANWTITNIHDVLPSYFVDGAMKIPEADNNVPDVLDEARWNMEFILGMQVPEGYPQAGMAHHKVHNVHWATIPAVPPTNFDNDINHTNSDSGRYLMPPSSAATLNLAATAAQSARVWKEYDSEFANECLIAAERAWIAALDNEQFFYGNIPGDGGGNYDDSNILDEFFWAAAELYVTTGKPEYYEFITSSPLYGETVELNPEGESAIAWPSVATLGRMTLALVDNNLSDDEVAHFTAQIIEMADFYYEFTMQEGYRVPLPKYVWGSNSSALNNALIMAYAHIFTGEEKYLDGVIYTMDYILGRNALNFSFVSGYGEISMSHPHHAFWADQPDYNFPPVPKGVICGGPNEAPVDNAAMMPKVIEQAISKRYTDNFNSYSTNEVAINWNSPLVWVVAYLDAEMGN